jgi:hypothetical protein
MPAAEPCMPSTPRSTRSGSIGAAITDTIRNRGLFGALRYYAKATVDFLRDLTPQRRRSRYGDIDYDFEHGVDTTWATVSLGTRLRELASGAQYQASEPDLFHRILQTLPVQPDDFTFIDLGSGKGRTLLMASDYPFHRIIGVELLPELNQIAQRNVAAYFSERQRCFKIESFADDAKKFEFPDEPLVLYLFNPFPGYVLQTVLNNLRESFKAQPREIYVIYHNLVHEDVFRSQSWLKELHRTHQFAIYQAI